MSLPVGCRRRSRHGRREGVAVSGVAVQAAIITGEGSLQVLDITTKLHERIANILTKDAQTFETYADNQPGILIQIFEGERAVTQNSNLLWEVPFQSDPVNANRITNVSAQDETSDDDAVDGTTEGVMTQVRNQRQCVVRVGDFQQQGVSRVFGRSLLETC